MKYFFVEKIVNSIIWLRFVKDRTTRNIGGSIAIVGKIFSGPLSYISLFQDMVA